MAKDNLSEHIRLTVLLLTAVLASTDHGLAMLLVDDSQIPVDQRYRLTTKAGYASEYTEGSTPYNFAQDFWAQSRSAAQLMLGRWISADTAGYYVGGVPNTNMAGFAALGASDGFSISVDGILADAATDVKGFDFDDVEDVDDVLAEINSVLHTVGTAAYAAYDIAIDSLGRVFVCCPEDVGPTSAQITIAAPSSGVDMTAAGYLNFVGGLWIDGEEAESPTQALTAIRALNDNFFCVCERGASLDQQVALAAYIQNLNKVCVLWEDDYANCDTPDSTTEAFPRICALGYNRTMCFYHPGGTLGANPDAVVVGAYLPADEGTVDWANWQLTGVTSGNLGSTVKSVLDGMKINYFETQEGITYNPYGMTAKGDEMRWVVGASWLFDAVQRDVFSAKIQAESWGFDIPTFGTLDGIVRRRCNEAVTRGFCIVTKTRPMIINIPDPDSFDQATRASHTANLGKVARVPLNSAIYDMALDIELAV